MNYLEKLLSLTVLSTALYGCGGVVERTEPRLPVLEQQTLTPGNYTIKTETGEINFLVAEDPSAVGPKTYDCIALLKGKEDSQILLFDNGCNDTTDYVVKKADSGEENVVLRFQLILSGQVSIFDGMMKALIDSARSGKISPTNLEEKTKQRGVRI